MKPIICDTPATYHALSKFQHTHSGKRDRRSRPDLKRSFSKANGVFFELSFRHVKPKTGFRFSIFHSPGAPKPNGCGPQNSVASRGASNTTLHTECRFAPASCSPPPASCRLPWCGWYSTSHHLWRRRALPPPDKRAKNEQQCAAPALPRASAIRSALRAHEYQHTDVIFSREFLRAPPYARI
jgi:hypothetical protein